jgi:hypothetical protein
LRDEPGSPAAARYGPLRPPRCWPATAAVRTTPAADCDGALRHRRAPGPPARRRPARRRRRRRSPGGLRRRSPDLRPRQPLQRPTRRHLLPASPPLVPPRPRRRLRSSLSRRRDDPLRRRLRAPGHPPVPVPIHDGPNPGTSGTPGRRSRGSTPPDEPGREGTVECPRSSDGGGPAPWPARHDRHRTRQRDKPGPRPRWAALDRSREDDTEVRWNTGPGDRVVGR